MTKRFPYPVWYIFAYNNTSVSSAYHRLKKSIASIPYYITINIIDPFNNLDSLNLLFPRHTILTHNISDLSLASLSFSKSHFYNYILHKEQDSTYFYFSDVDLVYPEGFFDHLYYLLDRLDSKKSDVRLILSNTNIAPICKISFVPVRLYSRLSAIFPNLFCWDIPASRYNDLQLFKKYPTNFAHGCGIFPVKPLQKIGGFNTEIVGHGPEDALVNARLSYYARVIYHKGNTLCQSLHLPHQSLHQSNTKKNHLYWIYYCTHSSLHGLNSNLIIKQDVGI